MRVKVIKPFRDKVTKTDYMVEQKLEFDDKIRVDDMVSRGLAEIIIEQIEQPKSRKSKS